jgi:hypothetical protein
MRVTAECRTVDHCGRLASVYELMSARVAHFNGRWAPDAVSIEEQCGFSTRPRALAQKPSKFPKSPLASFFGIAMKSLPKSLRSAPHKEMSLLKKSARRRFYFR